MLYRPAVRSSSQRFLIAAAALAGLLALAAAVPTYPPQLDSIAGDAWTDRPAPNAGEKRVGDAW
jgi:hypothetical protein